MNFSLGFSSSAANLVAWSPNGQYLAIPDKNKVYIKDGHSASSLLVTFTCYKAVKLLQWSPDSSLIMTGSISAGSGKKTLSSFVSQAAVEVWNITDPDWQCKIELGSAGLECAAWAPDSRHIITTDLFYVRSTIWSLLNQSIAIIKNPKECNPSFQFSCDGSYLAAAERIECKDYLTILETRTWNTVKQQFPVSCSDMAGLAWVLTTVKGAEPYGLGVRVVCWTPSGYHLIIGSQDTKLRVMCHRTWEILDEQLHSPMIEKIDQEKTGSSALELRTRVFRVVEEVSASGVSNKIYSEVVQRPVQLYPQRNEPLKGAFSCVKNVSPGGHPCHRSDGQGFISNIEAGGCSGGVSVVLLSCDGLYAATCVRQLPCVVWVWRLPRLELIALLVHEMHVQDVSWSPRQARLVITTGEDAVFMWTPYGSLTVPLPQQLRILPTAVRWHPSGERLVVVGKGGGQFCVLSLPPLVRKWATEQPASPPQSLELAHLMDTSLQISES
ncbi:WD repeat-containing protein WRAP73 [Hyalella azteca]|uniref:WD repeat-containing protein WRAP73 n=1 Tax=Hyalella azteca TaxID=294128 RepID=A0A8B7PPK4_HYAAZ|nr:WD repeat-containing protein WRAP73 [Hyalella azteca]